MSKITVKRQSGVGDIAKTLRKRRDLFKNPLGSKIIIPTGGTDPTTNALEWVLWQEFGTATKRKASPEFGITDGSGEDEYSIPGKKNTNPPDYMSFPPYKGRTYGFRKVKGMLITPKKYVISHPGYPPKKFIRAILHKARDILRIGIGQAVAKGFANNSDFIALEGATIKEMDKVKALIVASMRTAFGSNKRPDGRLGGAHPASVFKDAAYVVGLAVSAAETTPTGKSRISSGPLARRRTSKLVSKTRAKFMAKAATRKLTPKDRGFATAPLSKVDLRFKHPLISRVGRFGNKR